MRSLLHRYQRLGGVCCLRFQLESRTATESETSRTERDHKYREEACLFNWFEINTTEQTSYNNHHQCTLQFFRGEGVGKSSSLLSISRITVATDYNFLVTAIRSSFFTQPRDADTCRFPSNVYRLRCARSGTEVEVNSNHLPQLKFIHLHHY